jgi:hypothetical protein
MEVITSIVDITPTYPIVVGGYMNGKPLSDVAERLEANIAVLRLNADSDPFVIVSLDLLYPGRILRTALETALPELRHDQIFLAASHTHQAPMTDDTKLSLGAPDGQYVRALAHRISIEARRMIGSDQTQVGTFSTSTVSAEHSINRRLKRRFAISPKPPSGWLPARVGLTFNSYLMAPNPSGVTDELVTLLISRSTSGRAQFVMWNYACHPVSFPDKSRIAADYPHYVRNILRSSLGVANLPVIFLQGFSGNTRPSATVDTSTDVRSRIRSWLFGPCFTHMTWSGYATWATELGELVARACSESLQLDDVSLSSKRNTFPTSSFVEGADEPEVSFHAIRIGPDFAIVGASAEVVAEFAPKVRKMAGSMRVMCVGCLDHPFGYAPTDKILHEGGYEGGDYCEMFSLGPLVKDIEVSMLRGFESVCEDS